MKKNEINISVSTLAEEWGRRGDLNRLAGSMNRAHEGIRAHRRIQKKRSSGYEKEISVEYSGERDDFILNIKGRIDGIFPARDPVLLEEIKTTYYELEGFAKREASVHWSQARIYGYIYALEKRLPEIEIQVTCASLGSKEVLEEIKLFNFRELEEYFLDITGRLVSWHSRLNEWRQSRDLSLAEVPFPFEQYREGQRELAIASWRAVTGNRQLLVQSPTGTGKTVASLYPAVKVFPTGEVNRVIFLTARTTGQKTAESCLDLIRGKGGRIKSVTLTAKEKICPGEGVCTGEECQWARDYYERLGKARDRFFEEEDFSRGRIEEISAEHTICPYAFSRELHKWADCVICDLNYVFDPVVAAGTIPGDIGESALIVDEAHNLADRARDNFSASLSRKTFLRLRKEIKKRRRLSNLLKKADDYILELFTPGADCPDEPDPLFLKALQDLVIEIEKIFLQEDSMENSLRDLVFNTWCEVAHFIEVSDTMGDDYKLLLQPEKDEEPSAESTIRLYCIDPSRKLKETLDCCHSAIFLSGTLQPMEYYRRLNGCREDAQYLVLPSPYPRQNLRTLVYPSLSTRYIDREKSLEHLADVITDFANFRQGNYLVFFPSYAYLSMVSGLLSKPEENGTSRIKGELFSQAPGMKDDERTEFLDRFSAENKQTLVGMAVLGGAFGEGIDLIGDRLTGVIIVGVGLPSLSDERNCIKNYFDERGGNGFNYAYLVPGMTRVLQAAGRVIRSETDRGAILLIDDRFRSYGYKSLFPAYWEPEYVNSRSRLNDALEKFWGK